MNLEGLTIWGDAVDSAALLSIIERESVDFAASGKEPSLLPGGCPPTDKFAKASKALDLGDGSFMEDGIPPSWIGGAIVGVFIGGCCSVAGIGAP